MRYTHDRDNLHPDDRYTAEEMEQQFDSLLYSSDRLSMPSFNKSAESPDPTDAGKRKDLRVAEDQHFYAKGDSSEILEHEPVETSVATTEKKIVKLKKRRSKKAKTDVDIPVIRIDDESSFKETHFEDESALETESKSSNQENVPGEPVVETDPSSSGQGNLPGDQFNREVITDADEEMKLKGQFLNDGGVSVRDGQEIKKPDIIMDVDEEKVKHF